MSNAARADGIALHTAGRSRIKLKSTGEVFTLRPCNVKAHNVIIGGVWSALYFCPPQHFSEVSTDRSVYRTALSVMSIRPGAWRLIT